MTARALCHKHNDNFPTFYHFFSFFFAGKEKSFR